MLSFNLDRIQTGAVGTFGVLSMNKSLAPFCLTLEDPWRNNARNISCIPSGQYVVKKHVSPTHGDCWLVRDVPGRTFILFHRGNTHVDTQGCILVGEEYSFLRGVPSVNASGRAWEEMQSLLLGEREFWLNINWVGRPVAVPH